MKKIQSAIVPFCLAFSTVSWAGPQVPGNISPGDSGDINLGALGDLAVPPRTPPTRQVSTGSNLPAAFAVYTIWPTRDSSSASRMLGYLVVTGTVAPAGYLANYETFVWIGSTYWPSEFHLKLSTVSPSSVPTGVPKVDKFNNNIACNKSKTPAPTASRWQAKVLSGSTNVHVASLVKTDKLLGYWTSDTGCRAIAPSTDGWIDLFSSTTPFVAQSWGTPHL